MSLFITPQVHLKKPPGSYSIHIFHNQPVKYISFPPELLKNIDEHFVWGSFMYSWVKEMLSANKHDSKVTTIGSPRHDKEIFNIPNYTSNTSTRIENKKELVIGYAPSWDPYLSLRTNGLEIIRTASSLEKSKVCIRLHPCSLVSKKNNDFQFYTGGIDWHEKISSMKLNNVSFGDQISTIKYLDKIDILITDVSSIAFDAFLLNKPVIFYNTPEFWENLFSKYAY